MKTNELTGAALDWAVAKCEGRQEPEVVNNFAVAWYTWPNTHYSTDWAQGGPIIEREGIHTGQGMDGLWYANKGISKYHQFGRTPLIAAMRCYVASKLGDDIDIPEELIGDGNPSHSHKHLKEN
jgi:hypothetical protein